MIRFIPNRYRNFRNGRSIRTEIIVLIIASVTIPFMIISVLTYVISVNAVKKEFQNSSELILNNLSFNIDQYLQGIENASLFAYMDGRLQTTLDNFLEQPQNVKRLEYQRTIENFISSIESTIKHVNSVHFFIDNYSFHAGTGIYDLVGADYNYNYEADTWYQKTIASPQEKMLFGTHKPFQRKYSNNLVISFARVINKVSNNKFLGVILIDIRLDSIREILTLSENNKRNYMIIDKQGMVIYTSRGDHAELMTHLNMERNALDLILQHKRGNLYTKFADDPVYVNYLTSDYSGWKVIQYVSETDMIQESILLGRMFLALAVGSTFVSLLIMSFISLRIFRPLVDLSRKMKLIGQGNFDVELESKREDELGVLYRGVRKMIDDLKSYIERAATAKAKQKEAQFYALKSQINPHFLSNTLESIQMQAILNQQRHLGEMIGVLGKLFKIHTQTGKELVLLNFELEHIRLYIKLQQMRYRDKLNYVEQLDPDCLSLYVVHFMLQPIIENTITHGLEQRTKQGCIIIRSYKQGERLWIQVEDNGIGMSPERLQEVRLTLKAETDSGNNEHIGLKNVHDRIRLYFGELYGITIESIQGKGTTITICLPLVEQDKSLF